MKRHTVTAEELDEFVTEQWAHFAGCFSPDANKSFLVNVGTGVYQVLSDGAVTYEGSDKHAAIAAYNEA